MERRVWKHCGSDCGMWIPHRTVEVWKVPQYRQSSSTVENSKDERSLWKRLWKNTKDGGRLRIACACPAALLASRRERNSGE